MRLISSIASLAICAVVGPLTLSACASSGTSSPPVSVANPEADMATVIIEIEAAQNRGDIRLVIFDSADGWASGNAVAGRVQPVENNRVTMTVELQPGTYAIRGYHDLDGNGEMAMNPLGIPLEPFVFSGGAQALFGPPSFQDAAVEFPAGTTIIRMSI